MDLEIASWSLDVTREGVADFEIKGEFASWGESLLVEHGESVVIDELESVRAREEPDSVFFITFGLDEGAFIAALY